MFCLCYLFRLLFFSNVFHQRCEREVNFDVSFGVIMRMQIFFVDCKYFIIRFFLAVVLYTVFNKGGGGGGVCFSCFLSFSAIVSSFRMYENGSVAFLRSLNRSSTLSHSHSLSL